MKDEAINFINHADPTAKFDIDTADSIINQTGISVEEAYKSLTQEQKNMVMARFLGMDHVPVDIHTFLFDDYFLGADIITNHGNAIFKYWLDKFDSMFPNPIKNKYPYISFGGCIGSGKSFTSKMIWLYQYHKLDCCKNVYESIGLAGGTRIAMSAFHASEDTATKDFIQFFKFVFEISPYFRNLYNNPPIRFIASGPQATGQIIGTQLIFCKMYAA